MYATQLWQNSWNRDGVNKLFHIKSSVMHSFSRREDVVITRLRLGHTFLTHSFLLNNDPIPFCQTCGVELSVEHILLFCSNFNHHRSKLAHVQSLTLFFRRNSSASIINFLHDSNLLTDI